MRARWRAAAILLGAWLAPLLLANPAAAGERDILFWAPYGAGTREQAAETMDEFARRVARAAGWPDGSVGASYANSVDDGEAILERDPPGFVIVTAPVYLRYHRTYRWRALLALVTDSANAQRYSLYGPAGSSLSSLEGAPLVGDAAYDPAFVAGVVLGRDDLGFELKPTSRPLSAVRRAARGEPVAVLLDEGQRKALDSLPTASGLVLLAESGWMPAGIVAAAAGISDEDARTLAAALEGLGDDPGAEELLRTMRIRGFEPIDSGLLATLGRAYRAAGEPTSPEGGLVAPTGNGARR